jgi:hypothetical protein
VRTKTPNGTATANFQQQSAPGGGGGGGGAMGHLAQGQVDRLGREVESLATLLDNMQREKDMQRLEISQQQVRKAISMGAAGNGGGSQMQLQLHTHSSAMLPALSASIASANYMMRDCCGSRKPIGQHIVLWFCSVQVVAYF